MKARTRLFLVRHAETEWNTARIFQGHLDSNLTAKGLRQAEELAERLAVEKITALYSSDQGRAMRTAEVLAARLGLEVRPTEELREIHCGDWTGKSYDEVQAGWPEHFEDWRERPHIHCMPGGETVRGVQERGLRFITGIWERHPGESVCAVTHHTIVRSILVEFQGRPLAGLWKGPRQPNCAINLLERRNGEVTALAIADTAHLSEVATSGHTSVT